MRHATIRPIKSLVSALGGADLKVVRYKARSSSTPSERMRSISASMAAPPPGASIFGIWSFWARSGSGAAALADAVDALAVALVGDQVEFELLADGSGE